MTVQLNWDEEADNTAAGQTKENDLSEQYVYVLNCCLAHKTGLRMIKKRKAERGNRPNLERKKTFQHLQQCFWHGDVQMEPLTHCFNAVVFYQLVTVGSEGEKGGRWQHQQRHFTSSQIDSVRVCVRVCVGARTSWWWRHVKVKVVYHRETILDSNKCWWNNEWTHSRLSFLSFHSRKVIWAYCCP